MEFRSVGSWRHRFWSKNTLQAHLHQGVCVDTGPSASQNLRIPTSDLNPGGGSGAVLEDCS